MKDCLLTKEDQELPFTVHVFTILDHVVFNQWLKAVVFVRTQKVIAGNPQSKVKRVLAYFAEDLSFGTIVLIQIYLGGVTSGAFAVRIIKRPLLEWNVFADKIYQPDILLIELLN